MNAAVAAIPASAGVLLPLLDLLNHAPAASGERNCEKEYDAKAGAKDSGDDDLMELFGDFLDPDSSDSESDDGDDATAADGGEATKVLTDLGASVTTMAEGMFATVGAPEEPE